MSLKIGAIGFSNINYMCATEKDKKHEKMQCARFFFLSLAGESVIELSNTFIFEDHEHREKSHR